MKLIGVLGQDDTVPCADCHAKWSVAYLIVEIGRKNLRQEGFAFIWFDDDCICINHCPTCDMPRQTTEVPWTSLPALV